MQGMSTLQNPRQVTQRANSKPVRAPLTPQAKLNKELPDWAREKVTLFLSEPDGKGVKQNLSHREALSLDSFTKTRTESHICHDNRSGDLDSEVGSILTRKGNDFATTRYVLGEEKDTLDTFTEYTSDNHPEVLVYTRTTPDSVDALTLHKSGNVNRAVHIDRKVLEQSYTIFGF